MNTSIVMRKTIVLDQPRQTGKTTSLIRIAHYQSTPEFPHIIVTANAMSKESIRRLAESLGLEIIEPITFSQLEAHSKRNAYCTYLIDDVDLYLADKVGTKNRVGAISLSPEDGYAPLQKPMKKPRRKTL